MAASLPVRPGEIIGDRYRVLRIIGRGGMAVVVAAMDQRLDELVAIKVLLPERVESSEACARFMREARLAVKIKNPHVVRVTDVGTLDNGTPYMVMEHLDGEDLAALLLRKSSVPASTTPRRALPAPRRLHGRGDRSARAHPPIAARCRRPWRRSGRAPVRDTG